MLDEMIQQNASKFAIVLAVVYVDIDQGIY